MKIIGVIGGGVSGLATAIELSKLNYRIILFEKYSPAHKPLNNFLTFNFTINYRGVKSLQQLGLWGEVKARATPLHSRVIHSKHAVKVQKYSLKDEFVLYSIPRFDLLSILYESAKARANIDIRAQCTVTNIQNEKTFATIEYLNQGNENKESVDFVIAADGANSSVRTLFEDQFKPILKDFEWGYIETTIPKNESQLIRKINRKSLHVWPGDNFLSVGIPNNDESISLLYLSSFNQDGDKAEVENFLKLAKHNISQSVGNISTLPSLNHCSRIGRIKTVKCSNWCIDNTILLIGDAAHAICPFYGQGMNSSLEDACTLRDLLNSTPFSEVFEKFYSIRKPSMDILSYLSEKHFYRLKDKLHSPFYNAVYKLDLNLSRKYPKLWLHEYTKLSNSCDSIQEIHQRLKKQKLFKLNFVYAFMYLYYLFNELFRSHEKLDSQ